MNRKLKMKNLFKMVLVNFFVFALVILLFEVFLRVTTKNASNTSDIYKNKLNYIEFHTGDRKNPWAGYMVSHPLFGFTHNPFTPHINNYGFVSYRDYPYKKANDKEIVIGLYGGSVAEQASFVMEIVFNSHPRFEEIRKCGQKFTVLNLAMGASREPQQLHIYAHTEDWSDLTIKLDGRNDIMTDSGSGLPAEFPSLYQSLYQMNDEKLSEMKKISSIRRWQKKLSKLPIDHSWISKSYLYTKFFKSIDNYFEERILTASGVINKTLTNFTKDLTYQERQEKLLENYIKYTRMQHVLEESKKRMHFYFIQPSQYATTPKPMSKEEYDMAITKDLLLQEKYKAGYVSLNKAESELKKMKIDIHNLAGLFANTSKPVFVDDCCHMNDYGNEIMANKIVEIIGEKLLNRYRCK